MKTFLTLCFSALLLLVNRNISVAGEQDFTLVNATGIEIHALHVSPADKEEWGPDILGQDILADGDNVEIRFHPEEEADKWDLKVADKEGNSIEWNDLNLLKIEKVILHYNDG